MAWTTGTATSHTDLYDKLVAFLTTNPDLVAADQAWTKAWQHAQGDRFGVVLSGPGLAGLDRVLVGLKLTGNTATEQAAGQYWITTYGMTGVLGSAGGIEQHVNPTPRAARMFLDVGAMTYWFIANGRRFIVIVKISTIFESMYAGLFLPYATPIQYPYPMFLGGTAGAVTLVPDNWRNLSEYHRAFCFSSTGATLESAGTFQGAAWTLTPGAEWLFTGGTITASIWPAAFIFPNTRPRTYFNYALTGHEIGSNSTGVSVPEDVYASTGSTLVDEALLLTPMHLVREAPSEAVYGILDGCYSVSGHRNASENIITVGGVDHLVAQNTFRAGLGSYFALALE